MPSNILLVSSASPFNPQSGAQQRTSLLKEALSRLGKVDVLILEPGKTTHTVDTHSLNKAAHIIWRALPLGIAKFKPDHQINKLIAEALPIPIEAYDLIVGRYLNPISKLAIPDHIPTIVDLDDLGYQYGTRSKSLQIVGRLKSWYSYRLAKQAITRFNAFFFVSKRDQIPFKHLMSRVLPNIPFVVPANPIPATPSNTILFVGSLWYPPNREGIEHFLKHCWPRILDEEPTTNLLLVGAAPESVRKLWQNHSNVSAPGFVESLAEIYKQSAFTIAPIYFGGGTNIKILESLAHNRACITTEHCASAFSNDLVAKGGLSVAHTDKEFAAQCISLLRSTEDRQKQADIGHELVSTLYNKDRFNEIVLDLVHTITNLKPKHNL